MSECEYFKIDGSFTKKWGPKMRIRSNRAVFPINAAFIFPNCFDIGNFIFDIFFILTTISKLCIYE